jgi:alanyl-tRNA synthetase
MFEMMGNWSLNEYFKEEQIKWVLDLYVNRFKLDVNKLYVSVFAGDTDAPRDDDAIRFWQEQFNEYDIAAEVGPDTAQGEKSRGSGESVDFGSTIRIFAYGKDANWWQRGEAPGELGGPDSEIFYDTGNAHDPKYGKYCHVNCDCGRFIEIANNVFMQYRLDDNMLWQPLTQTNIDFGGGFERVVMAAQNKQDIFETDLYSDILERIAEISGKSYKTDGKQNEFTAHFRVLADHIRAASFIIADGINPSNKDQGYILRRLIRRMVRRARYLELERNFSVELAQIVIKRFEKIYPHLKEQEGRILNELEKEEIKFARTLQKGLKELQRFTGRGEEITGQKAFHIYETYGFPLEMIIEELKSELVNDSGDFDSVKQESLEQEFALVQEQMREQSRMGADQKFKGGLADTSDKTTALHTTHHLLLAALQQVLGKHVKQRGSNITSERLRIDVSHDDKISEAEIHDVEAIVNEQIHAELTVEKKTMPRAAAEELGAEMEFGKNYGDLVDVYFIKNDQGEVFSKEFCGGPHVQNTKELAEFGQFKIIKEESNGNGVRRLKAVLA